MAEARSLGARDESQAPRSRRRRLLVGLARWGGTLAIVLALVWSVDARAIAARLRHLDLRWVAAALALSLVYYPLVTLRWCFTAARVGAPISFGRALREYYLSTLLNQLLPVGIAGDIIRAARHRARLGSPAGWEPAARAVILERLSGLAALALFVIPGALVWIVRGRREWIFITLGAGALLLVAVGAILLLLAARRGGPLARDGHQALVARGALPRQLALSTAGVAILVAQFVCCARAAGAALNPIAALEVVPLILAATTIPWAFAGWGVREAATVVLFRLLGLDTMSSLTASLTFGLVGLAAALPGVITLVWPSPSAPSAEQAR